MYNHHSLEYFLDYVRLRLSILYHSVNSFLLYESTITVSRNTLFLQYLTFQFLALLLSLMVASTASASIIFAYSMLPFLCLRYFNGCIVDHFLPKSDRTFLSSKEWLAPCIIHYFPLNLSFCFSVFLVFPLPDLPPLSGLSLDEMDSPLCFLMRSARLLYYHLIYF